MSDRFDLSNQADWIELPSVPVTSILLDDENARISWMEDTEISQTALIKAMWERHKVRNLVDSIRRSGFYVHEKIIVIATGENQYTVVEGNRRLTALKVILNPELAPIIKKDFLLEVHETMSAKISRIPVVLAPSREAAYPIIVDKHASADDSSWRPLMKAHLYWDYAQKNKGVPVDIMATKFGVTDGDFRNNLRLFNLYRLIRGIADFPEQIAAVVNSADRFPITTFERVVTVDSVRRDLGLDDLWTLPDAQHDHFSARMFPIVIEICGEGADSRSLNTKGDIEKFYQRVTKDLLHTEPPKPTSPTSTNPDPSPASTGSNNRGEGAQPTTVNPSPSRPDAVMAPPHPRPLPSVRVRPYAFQTKIAFRMRNASSLRAFYDELEKLKVDNYPNAAAVMLRVFLDKATRHFLVGCGYEKLPVYSAGTLTKEVSFANTEFGKCLEFITSSNFTKLPDQVKKALAQFKDGGGYGKLDSLNQLIHNHEVAYTAADVRSVWNIVEEYLKIIMNEDNYSGTP